MKRHVFIIGAKSIGQYGGYETFVEKLIENHKDFKDLQYHIFCKNNGEGHMSLENIDKNDIVGFNEFIYNNAKCYLINVPQIGSAQAIYYDCASLNKAINIIKKSKIEKPIIYILACRIGPFFKYYSKIIHSLGGKIFINPDGHEWLRSKWGTLTKKYWKKSEELMVKYSDLVICDSKNIEKYIHMEYDRGYANKKSPKTTYLAYGSDIVGSKLKNNDKAFTSWLKTNKLKIKDYYLVVGRFVPENNYDTIIREFMLSKTKKRLAIITNRNIKFYNKLQKKYNFESDDRIIFAGTVYNSELLKKIRENAFAYIHGHSVGGTNPSLLEAMSYTKINLLYNVSFNYEVAKDSCFYWDLNINSLSNTMCKIESLSDKKHLLLHTKALKIIINKFNWKKISDKYYRLFKRG